MKLTVNGKTLHAADRGEAGSAREDAGAGDAAGLHAVEGGVLRRGRRAAAPHSGRSRCASRSQRLQPATTGTIADALAALDKKLESINGASAVLSRVMTTLTEADVRPTSLQLDIVARARAEGARVVAQWTAINAVDVPAVNARLTAAGLAPLAP